MPNFVNVVDKPCVSAGISSFQVSVTDDGLSFRYPKGNYVRVRISNDDTSNPVYIVFDPETAAEAPGDISESVEVTPLILYKSDGVLDLPIQSQGLSMITDSGKTAAVRITVMNFYKA